MEDFDSPDQPADGLDERSAWVAQVRAALEKSGADASLMQLIHRAEEIAPGSALCVRNHENPALIAWFRVKDGRVTVTASEPSD